MLAREVLKALGSYADEMGYYWRAKFRHPVQSDNLGLLIRKRAHHLERYLFKPAAYPVDFAEMAASELVDYPGRAGDAAPEKLRAWAEKILREWRSLEGSCGCRMLNEHVRSG